MRNKLNLILLIPPIYAVNSGCDYDKHNCCYDNFQADSSAPCGDQDINNMTFTPEQCDQYTLCCFYNNTQNGNQPAGCFYNQNPETQILGHTLEAQLQILGLQNFDEDQIQQANQEMNKLKLDTEKNEGQITSNTEMSSANSFKRMGAAFYNPVLSSASNYKMANTVSTYQNSLNSHLKRFGSQFDSNPTQTLIDKVPSCPVNVPLCRRDPCEPSNPDLEQDAFGCTSVPGCCFDMNLWLYKNWFGVYRDVPACYRAIKSPVYYDYVNKLSTWRPEWGTYIAKTFETHDRNNTDMWSYNAKCPNNKHWSIQVAQNLYSRINNILAGQNINPNNPAQGQTGQFGVPYNPIYFSTLNIVKKLTSNLNEVTKQIVDRLSGDCGWKDITRFECQMQGCCWQPNKNEDPLNDKEGRCIRHFDMENYVDDDKFINAISHALSDGSSEDSADTTINSGPSDNSVPHFGGNLPLGGYNNPYNSPYGNQNPYQPFGGMFGRKKRSIEDEPHSRSRRSPNMFMSLFANQRSQSNPAPFSNLNGRSQQTIQSPRTPFSPFGNSYGRNPRDEALLDSNPFAANPYQNMMENLYDPNNPTSMLAMQMMASGSSSEDIVKQMLEKQKLEQLKTYTNQLNPSTCPMIKPNKKRQCGSYTGSMKNDLNTCQARGCCFDVEAWNMLDKENQEKEENDILTSSKENEDDVPPWMRNGLAGNNQPNNGFGPTAHKFPSTSQTNKNPFGSSNKFMFGRRKRRSVPYVEPNSFSRSMVNIQGNPFLPTDQQILAVCTWENAFDEKHNLASMKPVTEQCCEQIMCYHADSAATWANWSDWSLCPVSCGGGQVTRTRICVDGENVVDDKLCRGKNTQTGPCNTFECPYMKSWSEWSSCSATCGKGSKTRRRECSVQGYCQDQTSTETVECRQGYCMSEWTRWGECDRPCGGGTQSRSRSCIEDFNCYESETQNQRCNTGFCESWSEWSSFNGAGCGPIPGQRPCGQGRVMVVRTCQGGERGAPGCPMSDEVEKFMPCSLSACPEWSNWGSWSECSRTQIKERYRECPIANACVGGEPKQMKGCFTNWSSWTKCNNWGSRTSSRRRYCQNKQYGCDGENIEKRDCDTTSSNNMGVRTSTSQGNSNSGGYPVSNGYGNQNTQQQQQQQYTQGGYPINNNGYSSNAGYGNQNSYQSNQNQNSYGYGNSGSSYMFGSGSNNVRPTQAPTYNTNPLFGVNTNAWNGMNNNFFG